MSYQMTLVDLTRQTNVKLDGVNTRLDQLNAKPAGLPGFNQ